MPYDPQKTYSTAFLEYLAHANVTGYDFYLTVADVGTAEALRLAEARIQLDDKED